MNDLLHDAVNNRDLPTMKSLVEGGRNVNVRNRFAETPLHLACRMGYIEGAEYLVIKGADTSRRDERGNTVLHEAAKSGNPFLCEKFIYLLPTLNKAGRSALHIAAEHGKVMSVRLLLDYGAEPLLRDQSGITPANLAMSNDHSDVSQAMINHKPQQLRSIPIAPPRSTSAATPAPAEPQAQMSRSVQSLTSLFKAARDGVVPNIHRALADGVDVDSRDMSGDTAMHIAAKRGQVEAINFLIEEGGDVSTANNDGNTPLHLACQKGHLEAAKCLVYEKPLTAMAKNKEGKTPLKIATGYAKSQESSKAYQEIVTLLKDHS